MALLTDVTLIIPNRAEPQLEATVQRLRDHFGEGLLVDVVDDSEGRGVGATLRIGVDRATTPWVLFVMADGSEDPACLGDLLYWATPDVDAVWGDRWRAFGCVEGYPPLKRIANRLGNWGIARCLGVSYRDWTDLAKLYRTDRLRSLHWSVDFRCTVEIPIRYWRAYGWRRASRLRVLWGVPMHWTERSAGQSSYSLGQALKVLWAALRVLCVG